MKEDGGDELRREWPIARARPKIQGEARAREGDLKEQAGSG